MHAVCVCLFLFFFFQAEDGIRDYKVTGVQTCALPIFHCACHGYSFPQIWCMDSVVNCSKDFTIHRLPMSKNSMPAPYWPRAVRFMTYMGRLSIARKAGCTDRKSTRLNSSHL